MPSLKYKPNILMSHFFIRDNVHEVNTLKAISPYVNIFIDSGAFSNNKMKHGLIKDTGDYVTLDEYIAACKKHYDDFWNYIALDVVRDQEQTDINLKKMLDAGLRPVPVLTSTEHMEKVEEYVKINRRVCIAGAAFSDSPDFSPFARAEYAHHLTDGKVLPHLLGFTVHPTIFKYPIATTDSSSMTIGSRFGSISYYNRREGFKSPHWKKVVEDKKLQFHLLSHGVTKREIGRKETYGGAGGIPALFTVNAYIDFFEHCAESDVGVFFALPNSGWVSITTAVYSSILLDDNNKFNYKIAKEEVKRIRDIPKHSKEKYYDELQRIWGSLGKIDILTDKQDLRNRFPVNKEKIS